MLAEILGKKLRKRERTIVLPEGTEERTLLAIKAIVDNRIARPILLGDVEGEVKARPKCGEIYPGAEIINPGESFPILMILFKHSMRCAGTRGRSG